MPGAAVLAERSFAGNPVGAQGLLRGAAPQCELCNRERTRLVWERAETDLVEQLAAASERVFDAKLTPKAVRQRLLPSVRQSRGGDWMLKPSCRPTRASGTPAARLRTALLSWLTAPRALG